MKKRPTTPPQTSSLGREEIQRRRVRRAVNLKRIKSPAPQHDLKVLFPDFESRIGMHAENRERIRSLREWVRAKRLESDVVRAKLPVIEVKRLITGLRRQRLGRPALSFASPTFTRA